MTSRALFKADRLLEAASGVRPVLGIDTSSPIARLALVAYGRVVASESRRPRSHAAELADAVAQLLASAAVGISDLAAVAVAIGPGSFTGLRIGISYAKGLAMASHCAVVGIPSLDCLALAALERAGNRERLICPVVDARRGEVYAALYAVVDDGLQKLTDDLVVTLESLTAQIDQGVLLAGDAKAGEAMELLARRGLESRFLNSEELETCGALVAAAGAHRVARGDVDEVRTLQPIYVRPTDAIFPRGDGAATPDLKEGVWSAERKLSFRNI
ncbi:MAG: tRNA (adenosine(37)-N6)-threonylcarbamoyltransferase complex dimerization subunit type 1 TsaB [Candidatus Binataceae bacterium]